MSPFQALILGLVQGGTEFLPISSSAHLIIVPWLLGWADPGLTFDVALHLGTLLAVVGYFWKDWVEMGRGLANVLVAGDLGSSQARTALLILAATVPGALAGGIFEHQAETVFRDLRIIAIMMMLLGLLLLASEMRGRREKALGNLSLMDSILIGIAQAFAIIPGVSRSGATITAGLFRGLERDAAARFSFLLGTPIILGAVVKRFFSLFAQGIPPDQAGAFVLGAIGALISGFICIAFLLRYLQNHTTMPFIVYRIVAGGGLLWLAVRGGVGS